jgi:catechol 2,3-dioxygenase-like lactoylglutathione lyase family enzyme
MNQIIKGRSPQLITLKRFFRRQTRVQFTLILLLTAIFFTVIHQTFVQAQHATPETAVAPRFQLHHVTLSVSDADWVSQWYVDTLEFVERERFTLTRPNGSQIQVVRVEAPGLQMNISEFDGSVAPNRTVDEQGWRHLAFQVDNVDQTYQRLQAEGVEFLTEPFTYDPPGYRIAFFRDPEGNILELYQDL